MTHIDNALASSIDRTIASFNWIPYGISFLDDALLGMAPTDLTLLGAYTGVGKTQIAVHVAINAAKQGKTVHFFALEAEENEIQDRAIWAELSNLWFKKYPLSKPGLVFRYRAWKKGDLDEEVKELEQKARETVRLDFCNINTIYRKGAYTADDFIDSFEGIKDETNLVIVDHMHYFDIEEPNEVRGLKNAIKKIRDATLKGKKPVLLLAHFKKSDKGQRSLLPDVDDFYGSSDLTKIATNILIVARAEDRETLSGNFPTWVSIAKARTAGDAQGYAGLLSYDLKTGNYSPKYKIFRARRWSEPDELVFEKFPRWAKNALIPDSAKNWMPSNLMTQQG